MRGSRSPLGVVLVAGTAAVLGTIGIVVGVTGRVHPTTLAWER